MDRIEGATCDPTGYMASDDLETSLPMVVWLRGDEDFVEEFTLDAEAAMEQLGIKRTRLTQISGRQLRVGRMRQGRYIKPLYRPEDVAAYLKSARAPMSHLKAAKTIEETKSYFEDIKESVLKIVEDAQASMNEAFHRALQSALEQQRSTSEHIYQQAINNTKALERLIHTTFTKMSDNTKRETSKLELQLLESLELITKNHYKMTSALEEVEHRFEKMDSELQAQNANLQNAVKSLKKDLAKLVTSKPNAKSLRVQKIIQSGRTQKTSFHHTLKKKSAANRLPYFLSEITKNKSTR